jgi:eukaryotic-like serine/threonine-protein kinase
MSRPPDDTPTTDEAPRPPAADAPLERGACIGRYVILERLGAGGMGVVYQAYDPELNRPIALKLLQADKDERARDRLLREAQALARLSHPNVIAVHDVGSIDEQVFIATEFVDGQTLRRWLREPHRRGEILDVFLAAGEGLVAAHAAGLVHRDFKPDNVMVGRDGRVRVLDFGLVRAAFEPQNPIGGALAAPDAGEATVSARRSAKSSPSTATRDKREPPSATAASGSASAPLPALSPEAAKLLAHASSSSRLSAPLTHAGTIMGTPSFMAPEQHLGEEADERADQFSFCLSLYEALYDAPPFADRDAVLDGNISDPPASARVPRWLRQVLVRGLALSPAARHPSMAALLAALRADPSVRRGRTLRWAGLVAMVVLVAVAWRIQVRQQARAGLGAERRLVGVWDEPRRAAVRASFRASGKPYAESVLHMVEDAFDDYARSWVSAHVNACEATRMRGEQSQQMLDLRMACLSDRLTQLGTLTELYTHADEQTIDRASTTAATLPRIDTCADTVALRAPVPPPEDPTVRRRVEEERDQLARAKAFRLAAKYDRGLQIIRAALAQIAPLSYRPVEAEARLELGRILTEHGDFAEATHAFHDALVAAMAGRHEEVQAWSLVYLMMAVGEHQAHYEEAESWAELAEAAVGRLQPDQEVRRVFHIRRSALRSLESKLDDAFRDAQRALELTLRDVGTDSLATADALQSVGSIEWHKAQFKEALEHYYSAMAIYQRRLGPAHPTVGKLWSRIGDVQGDSGQLEQALAQHRRALEVMTAINPNHPFIATIRNNMGADLNGLGRVKEAADEYRIAYEQWNQRLGPSHETAVALHNLGNAMVKLNRLEEAVEYYDRSYAVCEKVLGLDHELTGLTLHAMGEAYLKMGKLDEAMPRLGRALAIIEKAMGPKHLDLAAVLLSIGQVQTARHMPRAALAPLERALAIRQTEPADGVELNNIRFALAQARWADGDHRDAVKMATDARDGLAAAGTPGQHDLGDVTAWLVHHR